uniref:Uncharacterized protein n=2 Tax=Aegilops tauschii subsp. strangulata TaxID=200361 RepID=A0A452YQR2_AEGTS
MCSIFCEELLLYEMAIIWARLVQQIQIGPWILAGSRLDFLFVLKVNSSYFLISFVYILILLLQNLETHDMIYTYRAQYVSPSYLSWLLTVDLAWM